MTLVETVIAVAISSAFVAGALAISVYAQRATVHAVQHNLVERESRYVSDLMTRDLRNAINLQANFSDGTNTWAAGNDTIILRLPAINAQDRAIDIHNIHDHIIYTNQGTGNVMWRRVRPHAQSTRAVSDRAIGRSVTPDLSLQGTFLVKPDALGAFVVHYQFLARQSLGDRLYLYEKPVAGSVRLRNKL